MADGSRPKVVAKYGLVDDSGKVLLSPMFDDVIINEHFVLGKIGEHWGIIKDTKQARKNHFSFTNVMVYKNVLWFQENFLWGAMDSTGRILVEPRYRKAIQLNNSYIVRATLEAGNEEHYFSMLGERIFEDMDEVDLEAFKLGYALMTGVNLKEPQYDFFIVRNNGSIYRSFTSEQERECLYMLDELREDTIWSIPRG